MLTNAAFGEVKAIVVLQVGENSKKKEIRSEHHL